MRLAILLTSTVIMMLLSCSESETPQPKCETYYLRSLGGSPEAYYYSNGLISEYIMDIDTIARFEYYPNNLLRLRKSNEYSVYYFYDGEGRLMYALDYKNDVLRDSITFEYNPKNLISAINHYTRLNFILQRTERNEYDYAGKNSTQVRFYDLDSNNLPNLILTGTFLFEFDNKKIPFPKETWPFDFRK